MMPGEAVETTVTLTPRHEAYTLMSARHDHEAEPSSLCRGNVASALLAVALLLP
jgi:hypothetical protein